MRVLAGRDSGPQDDAASPGAVVENETAARDLWPGRQAVGRRLRGIGAALFTVIGVVSDSTCANRRERRQPVCYLAAGQLYGVPVYDPAIWLAVSFALASMALLSARRPPTVARSSTRCGR
jgi:hypothetical protein